jgi:molybdate/tungstate transport system substrate-binding protein
MGTVMDRAIGPAFAAEHRVTYQGEGQGAYALARLIASGQLRPDVFLAITEGPMELLLRSGLIRRAVPVASTQMVIAYSPKSRFAGQLAAAAAGRLPWYQVLETPGLRFGRTDPRTDPQGQNIVFTFLLAERYYHQPGLERKVLGPLLNPAEIFTETSLLARLQAGQIDATSGYLSAVKSLHLPYIPLPGAVNLSDPALERFYQQVALQLPGGSQVKVSPLVFYAAVPKTAPDPALGEAFLAYLRSQAGQAAFSAYGYGPPSGPPL